MCYDIRPSLQGSPASILAKEIRLRILRNSAHTREFSNFCGLKIHGKIPYDLPKIPLRNVRTMTILVNPVHKPTYSTFHVLKSS